MIITKEQFQKWLDAGREIEFFYKGLEYFIGNYDEGRAIFQSNTIITAYYKDTKEFLNNATIDAISIKEIISKDLIQIVTIF